MIETEVTPKRRGRPPKAITPEVLVAPPAPTPDSEEKAVLGALNPRETLLGQAFALGMPVNPAWDDNTLAENVLKAQEKKAIADKAAFATEPKTPVRLLRDAWPVENEKHRAGEIINVPYGMARHWITNGVAERADPFPGEVP